MFACCGGNSHMVVPLMYQQGNGPHWAEILIIGIAFMIFTALWDAVFRLWVVPLIGN
jgi:hypothetical protein